MSLNETQQLSQLLEKSRHILLVLNSTQNTDSICGAVAWKKWLEKQNKQVDIIADNFILPKNLKFIVSPEEIQPQISHLQKFILKVDVTNVKIDTLSYDIKDNWLSIYLTPKQGVITKNELRTAQSSLKYDLVMTINAQDLESLGKIFFNNTDLFYKVPIVNFDNHPGNEHFGQVNFVEITATSVSEIIYKTVKQISPFHIDAEIATALLAGMISQTQSFKTTNVTPHTLNTASELMNLGADREKIVKHLYRTKSISSLKIWGEALTHMESEPSVGLVWTSITREDFSRTGATEEELKELIDELASNSPEAKVILLLYENTAGENKVHGFLSADKQRDAKVLLQSFQAEGNKKTASFVIANKTLKEVELEVVEKIKKILGGKI
ncbi:MAG TPA: DHH family phosphoesterase [Candidatus Udaeobacter sp.]|nr:DHH family phosphoesterase [Candidatus Udaeobacter sp.]